MSLVIYKNESTPFLDMPAEIMQDVLEKATFEDEKEAFDYVRNLMTTCKVMLPIIENIRVKFNNRNQLPFKWFFKHLISNDVINNSVSLYIKIQKNKIQCIDVSDLFNCDKKFINEILENQKNITNLTISYNVFSNQISSKIKELLCLKHLEIKIYYFNDDIPSIVNPSNSASEIVQPASNQNLDKLTVEKRDLDYSGGKLLRTILLNNLNIKDLHLKSFHFKTETLTTILKLTELKKIVLDTCSFSDFISLASLKHLEEFEANSSSCCVARVEHFKDCPALKKITWKAALNPFYKQDLSVFKDRVEVFIGRPT